MARAKASILSVKRSRLALPVSGRATFESLGDGVAVGYRRNNGAGTWIVRKADGKGGSTQRVIGIADDFEDADAARVLSWAQAQAKALDVSYKEQTVSPASRTTLSEAIDAYESDLKTRGGDAGNVARVRAHIPPKLGNKAVVDLVTADLRKWRDGLLEKLAPATVNRTANGLRAALELAARDNAKITNRNAWHHGLAGLPDAESPRNVILSDAVVAAIVKAAYGVSHEFGLLVETAAVTGARYSQIAGLRVSDMLPGADHRLNMPTSRKGKGIKKVLRRPVPITPGLAAKLKKAIEDREAVETGPLLVKSSGEGWSKSDHSRLFRRAVKAAELEPADIAPYELPDLTIYALRHSSIVRSLLRSVPVRVVAVQHDTSVAMIERNYSVYLADHADALARLGMIDLDGDAGGNVVPLKRAAG